MICPFCSSSRYFLLRDFDVAELRTLWSASLGFDPYPIDMDSSLKKCQCAECRLIYFSPECFGDAAFYSTLSREPSYYEKNKWEFDVALELIAETKPVSLLEVGCGAGCFLEKVEGAVEHVEGVDINERAVEICRSKGLHATTAGLGSLKQKFDMVLLFEVLEHLENPAEAIESLLNVLESNGILVLAVPNPDGYLKDIDLNLLDMPPHHNSSWPKDTFDYIAEKYNLKEISYAQEPLRYAHYTGYLGSLIANHKSIVRSTAKTNLSFKLQSFVVRTLAPLTYQRDCAQIVGQTHLVALRRE